MRYGICVVIGKPAANSDSMVSETFAPELARSACPAALLTEHEGKKELLRRLDIGFMELEPPDGAANFIYTRDQMVMTRQGRVLFCSMQRPERRPEVTVFKQTFGVKSGRDAMAAAEPHHSPPRTAFRLYASARYSRSRYVRPVG